MKNLKYLFILAIICFSAMTASAQLKAYKFNYKDQFGGTQKCYMTLRNISANWNARKLDVLFDCYEDDVNADRGVAPRKIFAMNLSDASFVAATFVTVEAGDVGKPRAIALSDWAWQIALTNAFVEDYSFDQTKNRMVATRKSLTQLGAILVNVPMPNSFVETQPSGKGK